MVSDNARQRIIEIASSKALTDGVINELLRIEAGLTEDILLDVITEELEIRKKEEVKKPKLDLESRRKAYDVKLVHSAHPQNEKGEIALVYINNKVHEPTLYWLAAAANWGGRNGNKASSGTLLNMATEIASFFRELGEIDRLWEYEDGDGSSLWKYVTQSDMKHLRDTNLHHLDGVKESEYKAKAVSNNAMRIKMYYWFSFFHFQYHDGQTFLFTPTFSRETAKRMWQENGGYLNFLDKKGSNRAAKSQWFSKWEIMPPPGAKKRTFHALSYDEFKYLRKCLRDQDVVFELLALFEVKTGLRVNASLDVNGKEFQSYFKHLNYGKHADDNITMEFTNKGNEFKNTTTEVRVPLNLIQYVQFEYFSDDRFYEKRRSNYKKRVKAGKSKAGYEGFWFLPDGRPVTDQMVQEAFRKASKKMGRTRNITPHWMRHTFATWTVMFYIKKMYGGEMAGTGINVTKSITEHLATLMFHVSDETTKTYIATAYEMLKIADLESSEMAPVGLQKFRGSEAIQKHIKAMAKEEFGKDFDESIFDIEDYGIKRGQIRADLFGNRVA